eukprot:CAMPEP_0197889966 /NCGR_PEP_ID=MMETSP1439-20131203/24969_1 /TAXON_ID=66791 /ORGANISM="Gonyaulax spinifera, Strain CCMP409" /LENGTH=336 /DNA_ID=CAMNT_0043509967 /DNA_START=91 /DNA_END=1104 /DNA_ORIENTATION=+
MSNSSKGSPLPAFRAGDDPCGIGAKAACGCMPCIVVCAGAAIGTGTVDWLGLPGAAAKPGNGSAGGAAGNAPGWSALMGDAACGGAPPKLSCPSCVPRLSVAWLLVGGAGVAADWKSAKSPKKSSSAAAGAGAAAAVGAGAAIGGGEAQAALPAEHQSAAAVLARRRRWWCQEASKSAARGLCALLAPPGASLHPSEVNCDLLALLQRKILRGFLRCGELLNLLIAVYPRVLEVCKGTIEVEGVVAFLKPQADECMSLPVGDLQHKVTAGIDDALDVLLEVTAWDRALGEKLPAAESIILIDRSCPLPAILHRPRQMGVFQSSALWPAEDEAGGIW